MNKWRTILNKEITLPELVEFLPDDLSEWLSFFSICIFFISPLIVAIPCLIHRSIDFTIFFHPTIIGYWIWPLSGSAAFMAMLADLRKKWSDKINPWSLLTKNFSYICFFFLAFWMLIATTVNGWNEIILSGAGLRFETIFMQIGYFLLLFPAATLIRNNKKKLWLIRIYEIISIIIVITAFILWKTQLTSERFIWTPGLTAIYSNINYYGYYLSMSVSLSSALFICEKKHSWSALSLISVIANSIALSYNDTNGAWVACTCTITVLLVVQSFIKKRLDRKSLFVIFVFILCLSLPGLIRGNLVKNVNTLSSDITKIYNHSENAGSAGSGRWLIWQRGLSLIRKNPLFGIGFEGIDVLKILEFAKNNRIHNEFLQYTLFYGVPAGILYFIGCLSIFCRAWKQRSMLDSSTLCSLIASLGYLISSIFGLTLFCTTPFLFFFLGMGYFRIEHS